MIKIVITSPWHVNFKACEGWFFIFVKQFSLHLKMALNNSNRIFSIFVHGGFVYVRVAQGHQKFAYFIQPC